MNILQQRADFLRCAQGRKQAGGGLLLQGRDRDDGSDLTRVGFTASKKIGNAVARNRAKRRMRALAREILVAGGQPGWDYVLVARPGVTTTRDFAELRSDLTLALTRLHSARK